MQSTLNGLQVSKIAFIHIEVEVKTRRPAILFITEEDRFRLIHRPCSDFRREIVKLSTEKLCAQQCSGLLFALSDFRAEREFHSI